MDKNLIKIGYRKDDLEELKEKLVGATVTDILQFANGDKVLVVIKE